ncbi:hypothetical protein Hamer_G023565 [Homarus americanus]|uniref:Uncharacterized protein n=1 Tax=Homarus americanus TaxID=6706 RepID=A0A8J5JGN2_HOMAM|nr:hypothetical protein Hamer_G023565 [Homarus americanus]
MSTVTPLPTERSLIPRVVLRGPGSLPRTQQQDATAIPAAHHTATTPPVKHNPQQHHDLTLIPSPQQHHHRQQHAVTSTRTGKPRTPSVLVQYPMMVKRTRPLVGSPHHQDNNTGAQHPGTSTHLTKSSTLRRVKLVRVVRHATHDKSVVVSSWLPLWNTPRHGPA